MSNIQRPQPGEYKAYFQAYIDLVPYGDFMEVMKKSTHDAIHFLESIPASRHDHRYGESKWTIKQSLIHMIDVERVMTYRALVAARGDRNTALYSIDDNLYVQNSGVENRTYDSLVQEFRAVRAATEVFLATVSDQQSRYTAHANGHPTTTRALAYITTGHVLHHMHVISTRYLEMKLAD